MRRTLHSRQRRNNLAIICVIAYLILPLLPSIRAKDFDARKCAATIAPYVTDDVTFIARLDLTRINVAETARFLRPILFPTSDESEMANTVKQIETKLGQLKDSGGGEIFLVGAMEEFPLGLGFMIATVRSPMDANGHRRLAAMLFSGDPDGATRIEQGDNPPRRLGVQIEICEKLNDVVFAGSTSALERLKTSKPDARAELANALDAVGDMAAQLILIPSNDHRRVLREMLPRLPDELGGGSGRVVADGVSWVAVGLDAPPHARLNIAIQLKDAESVGQVKGVVSSMYLELSRNDTVRRRLPELDEILAAMTPKVKGDSLIISLDKTDGHFPALVRAVAAPITALAADARRQKSMNIVRQIAIAFHNHADTYKRFPAVENFELQDRSKQSKHPHSWRVAILPHFGRLDLFNAYNFDEPWDSENNRKLISKLPDVFASGDAKLTAEGKTTYLAPIGSDSIFSEKEGVTFSQIKDGTSNTIMIVEAHPSQAVIWTKPDDLKIDDKDPLSGLKGQASGGFVTVFCDGSSHFIPDTIDIKTLRALFTKNGGEPVGGF